MFDSINKSLQFSFGGPNGDRFRVNWFKLCLAVILMIATGVATRLYDHNKHLYTGWSLFGLVIIAAGLIVILLLLAWAKRTDESWPVFAAFGLGVLVTAVVAIVANNTSASAKSLAAGIITFMVIGGCLIGIGLTDWWRPEHRLRH